jgi:hypothetical protein
MTDSALHLFIPPVENLSKFGRVVVSMGVQTEVPLHIMTELFQRHLTGDWGDVDKQGEKLNSDSIKKSKGGTIYSTYKNAYKGKTIFIHTHGYGLTPEDCGLTSSNVAQLSFTDYCHTVMMFPAER